MEQTRKQIIEIIKRSKRILVMPSAPADGDSLGSALALYLSLKKLGKEVTVVSAEPVPDAFEFLPTTNVISDEFSPANDFIVTIDCQKSKLGTIKTKLEQDKVNIIITAKSGQFSSNEVSFSHGPGKYDVIITVDTGDLVQLGRFYEDNTEIFTQIPVINIDHHASNGQFGRINLVDIMASATTEMLIPIIEELERDSGIKLMDEDIATLLLAGIITDTGSFQNANTTPRSFAASAHLVKHGARQQEIIQHVFKTKPLSTLRLWGRILSNIKVDQTHRFVWATISQKDFAETESRYDETGGIIDELMTNAPGTEVVILLKQRDNNVISGSVRTTSTGIDSSKIAAMFGGGGHVQAAGFRVESANLEATERLVVEKVLALQKERLHLVDEEPLQNMSEKVPEITGANPSEDRKEIAVEYNSATVPPFTQETDMAFQPEKADETNFSTPEEVASLQESEIDKSTTSLPESSETALPATPAEETTTTFTDLIIRKTRADKETEIQPGMVYKFEE